METWRSCKQFVYLFNSTVIKKSITVGRLKGFGSKTGDKQICTLNMATIGEPLCIGICDLVVIWVMK
jgi:hypothetical protein